MTTARVLIQAAYREGNLIPVGAQPSAAEITEALPRLNRYVRGVFGFEMGEPLDDWQYPAPQRTAPVAANFPQGPYESDPTWRVTQFPPKNSRIVWGGNADTSIYFPEAPDDGSRMGLVVSSRADLTKVLTIDANGRNIEGSASLPMPVPPVAREWLYRADLGNWLRVVDAAIDDDIIFPSDHDDLFTVLLAVRLAPRYGKTISPETQAIGKTSLARFKAAYRQSQNTIYNSQDFPNSAQSYLGAQWWW